MVAIMVAVVIVFSFSEGDARRPYGDVYRAGVEVAGRGGGTAG